MDLAAATSMLARTPKVLDTLLAGLAPERLDRTDGPGTWSAYDIVGHLLHGEATNWLPRARMILEHGPGRAFEPFDRLAMLRQERGQARRSPQPPTSLLGKAVRAWQGRVASCVSLVLLAG
ncbi:MAG TPA: hypothetical protein VFB84_05770 [Micromonosporaceae bacterium]|nr:hypothetical protein [Micromonosporaceae bacterium]